MLVTIKLFQLYHPYLDERFELDNGELTLELDANTCVRDVIDLLSIPEEMVKILLINSRPCTFDQTLKEKDHIFIFPPVAGG